MDKTYTRAYAKTQVGAGWAALVDACFDVLDGAGIDYVVDQVKEKFGGLRFYWHSLSKGACLLLEPDEEELHRRVGLLEEASLRTCEECGAPGTRVGKRWLRTLCTACAVARTLEGYST